MIKVLFAIALTLLTAPVASADVQTKTVTYTHGSVELEGFLAWDDSLKGKRPGILVVHEWWGLNDYARQRAQQLAAMGYVAFALDMYGKGKVTQHPDQAGTWMKHVQSNIQVWQARALAGLNVLSAQKFVDPERLAGIGYCFGGSTVIQLVYSGAPVRGVVSFHGLLPLPDAQQAPQTRARILIAHGNADSFVSEEHLRTFRSALDQANVDWQMIVYSGARHSFTNPGADSYGMDALRYNKQADERSWSHMKLFFDEIFAASR